MAENPKFEARNQLISFHPESRRIYALSVGAGFILARGALELRAFFGRAKALRYIRGGKSRPLRMDTD